MNKSFFTNIKNIRNAIDTNKLVVFAGTGISIDSGVPNWNSLIKDMKSEIDIPNEENDNLRIAQMYYNDRLQKNYIDKVRTLLKHKKCKFNEIHQAVFKLNPQHILTTNYDDLLEQVVKKESLPFSVVSKDKEFPYALNTNLLVKIHGDLDDTDIVLKEDDYLNYTSTHPLTEAFLKSVFASKVVLFIGYSFSDINLKMIIQTVRNILGKDFQNAYLLSVDKQIYPAQRDYLKCKGINLVHYNDALDDNNKNYITAYLNGKNVLTEKYFWKGKGLSETGQNLLNFLTFISSYDKVNEPLTEKNVIDQIYFSLNRFSEFSSLPPEFIANLYPFNNSNKQVYDTFQGYSLLTRNYKLYDLFFKQIEYVDDDVKYNPPLDLNLSDSEIESLKGKLKQIIRTLNYSLIFNIYKENKRPDSLGYRGWSDDCQKLHTKYPEEYDGLNCSLEKFEYAKVIKDLMIVTINETSNIQSDLDAAYANYKIGNFYRSYKLFEEIANKAWQTGKYFTYYIAKYNIKSLRFLIKSYEPGLSEDERTKIVQELEDIDFDKLLSQIPYLGKKEYQLFKTVRDERVLIRAEAEIERCLEKIVEVYEMYKDSRGTTSGPYYPQTIEISFLRIITFYRNNFIIADEFSRFENICRKGIKGLLISFATSSEYDGRLKEFNKLFFDITLWYGYPDEIKKTLKKYDIATLPFNDKDLHDILDIVNNFLKSFFEKCKFFFNSTNSNKAIENQINNYFFEDKCRKNFSNILLLLSKIQVDKEVSSDLIKNLLGFIEHETFLTHSEMQYLSAFMIRNSHLFIESELESIIKSIIHKAKKYIDGNVFEAIAYVCKKNNFVGISDRDLIFSILSLNKQTSQDKNTIVYLWKISDDIIKEEIKKYIIQQLDDNFDFVLYENASYENIIDFNLFFEKFVSEIDSRKGNGEYMMTPSRQLIFNYTFINAIAFIYYMQIPSNDQRLSRFTNLSEYMKFYLNPENFNYDNFKIEWLRIIVDEDVFYKRLSKISILKEKIVEGLKQDFDKKIAEVYVKYFL